MHAAPLYHQDKNGLAKRHWQTMVPMAWNRLVYAELPSTFWFYAVCHPEVCNYFPYKLEDGSYTTPFKLVRKEKPDLRVLFKHFSLTALHHKRIGDDKLNKFESQSLPMIVIGHCQYQMVFSFIIPSMVRCFFHRI